MSTLKREDQKVLKWSENEERVNVVRLIKNTYRKEIRRNIGNERKKICIEG